LLPSIKDAQDNNLCRSNDECHAYASLKTDDAQTRPDMITNAAPFRKCLKPIHKGLDAGHV